MNFGKSLSVDYLVEPFDWISATRIFR